MVVLAEYSHFIILHNTYSIDRSPYISYIYPIHPIYPIYPIYILYNTRINNLSLVSFPTSFHAKNK